MFYLFLSVLLTSSLTLSFKFIDRWRIPVSQAIVFNYLTCVVTGCLVNGSTPFHKGIILQHWFLWACITGLLFISLFNLIGLITQKIGVAVASVSNKLSLVIPFLFSLYFYGEQVTIKKLTGILIALFAVVLTCMPSQKQNNRNKIDRVILFGLPLLLFVGSGLLDTLIKYTEQNFLSDSNENFFLITTFTVAGLMGLFLLLFLIISGKTQFDFRSIVAGVLIGIPNYFSIWSLVKVLKIYHGNSSVIIPVNNIGIVLFSTITAWLLFREKLSFINWLGICLSLVSISLTAFG